MAAVVIILLAAISILWRIEPTARPFIDVGMWLLVVGLLFLLGVRFDDWLTRLAGRRKLCRSSRKQRQPGTALSLPSSRTE